MSGSYGSYSSIASNMATPINIGSPRSTTACAFPSWPRSAALSDNYFGATSSYLSDEDLVGDEFDDSASNASSASSRSNSNAGSMSPPANYCQPDSPFVLPPQPSEEELAQRLAERQAYQREIVRAVLLEKERRKLAARAARRQRRAAADTTATTSRQKSAKLTVISEAA